MPELVVKGHIALCFFYFVAISIQRLALQRTLFEDSALITRVENAKYG
jgi:hypothetical protein